MPAEIEPFYFTLGRQIERARSGVGLSQAQLGERLDPKMTRASIANIENAKQRVLAHRLVELAGVLGLPLSELAPPAQDRSLADGQGVDLKAELARKLGVSEEKATAILGEVR